MRIRNWALGLEAREAEAKVDDDTQSEVSTSEVEVPAAADADVNNGADTPADDATEADLVPSEGATADETEVDSEMEQGDRLASDISDLQNISSVVADSIDDGGMEESARRIVDVAVESFCRRWDIPHVKVGNESLYRGSKMIRTRVALEGIGEVITNGVKKIIAWIKNAIKSIGKWFSNLAHSSTQYEKQIASLKKIVPTITGEAKSKFSDRGWGKSLSMNGKKDPAAVWAYVDKMATHTKLMTQDAIDTMAELHSYNLIDYSHGGFVTKFKLGWAYEHTIKPIFQKMLKEYGVDEKAFKSVCPMPGDNFLVVLDVHGITRMRFIQPYHVEHGGSNNTINVPTKELIEHSLVAGEKYVKLYKERLDESGEYLTNLKKLEAMLEHTEKAAADNKEPGFADAFKASINNIQLALSNAQTIQRGMLAGLKSACIGCIGYAQAGVACYKKAKAESSESESSHDAGHEEHQHVPGTELAVV